MKPNQLFFCSLGSYDRSSLLDHLLAVPNQCSFRPFTVHHHQLVLTQAGNDFLALSSHVPFRAGTQPFQLGDTCSTLRAIFIVYKPIINCMYDLNQIES